MSAFVLPVQYLRQMADQVEAMGASANDWLSAQGLSQAQLEDSGFQPDFGLFCRLFADAQALTGDAAFGLLLGERLLINTHGILGFAALQSASPRQAIQLIQDYLALRTTLVSLQRETDAKAKVERLVFVANYPLAALERPILEAVMLSVRNILAAITMGGLRLRYVSFTGSRPDYRALAEEVFGSPLRYGQAWTGFALESAQMDLPLRTADPMAFRGAEELCRRELEKLAAATTVASRVRRLMLEKQTGFPSHNLVARLLKLPPWTLHRRLQEEGSSYKQILEEVRHTLAIDQLRSSQVSVEEVAFRLGYTDVANFRRAFKRWEGIPPMAYRAQFLADE